MQQFFSIAEVSAFVAQLTQGRRTYKQPFHYPIDVPSTATTVTTSAFQTIIPNTDFLLTNVLYEESGANVWDQVAILMQDSATRQRYMDSAVFIPTWATNVEDASQAMDLPYPIYLAGATRLQFDFTNNSGSTISGKLILSGINLQYYS